MAHSTTAKDYSIDESYMEINGNKANSKNW